MTNAFVGRLVPRLRRCSQVLLLPRGVPPTPAPALLHTGRGVGGLNWAPPTMHTVNWGVREGAPTVGASQVWHVSRNSRPGGGGGAGVKHKMPPTDNIQRPGGSYGLRPGLSMVAGHVDRGLKEKSIPQWTRVMQN